MFELKAVAIGGSPRVNGNTNLLLRETLSAVREEGFTTEIIYAHQLGINGCLSCGSCEETGVCVVQDKMQGVYRLLYDASLIFMASPIYFSGISAQLKAVIDRSQALWFTHFILKQPVCADLPCRLGGFISTRGQKGKKTFETAEIPVRAFFNTIDAQYLSGLFVDDCDPSGIIKERPRELKRARDYGKDLARLVLTAAQATKLS